MGRVFAGLRAPSDSAVTSTDVAGSKALTGAKVYAVVFVVIKLACPTTTPAMGGLHQGPARRAKLINLPNVIH